MITSNSSSQASEGSRCRPTLSCVNLNAVLLIGAKFVCRGTIMHAHIHNRCNARKLRLHITLVIENNITTAVRIHHRHRDWH